MSALLQSLPTPLRTMKVDALSVLVFPGQAELATYAAHEMAHFLAARIQAKGEARIILATGNSQIAFLKQLIGLQLINWSKTTLFHMDEYLGLPGDHKASFRRYMRERVETLVHPHAFHYLLGDADLPIEECERYSNLLSEAPIDLCCMGIGENGHLAFNDPPVANFQDQRLVKLVKLDLACKTQQVNEGHFPTLDAVPPYALTLTIPALCKAERILCISPETRKARAVRAALRQPISTDCPASWLRTQPQATLLLDQDSAALL
ncbi:MAG: glucosamine-6-phosphate deaminase [Verrucomicrobiota bacterium]|nr:glucosamine-6-phosphate deaminase [Verrucomicrobiota bacterium]